MAAKLFVGNLPDCVTDAVLHQMVTRVGFQVVSALVIRDKTAGSSRSFGFVTLAHGEDVQGAVDRLNGYRLAGKPLTVFEILGRETRLLFKANIAGSYDGLSVAQRKVRSENGRRALKKGR